MDWSIRSSPTEMPSKDIFCNSPWYELQIYWDGSLGFCCHTHEKLYADSQSQTYNVKNMSIQQWFDSEPMRSARQIMFNTTPNSMCTRCYTEEQYSATSRRHRSNQKSVIFTRTNFDESYEQSPGYNKFEHSRNNSGEYSGLPIDLHIDLGNYCNLTCKMCRPEASSSIAVQHVKWGITSAREFVGTDWTRDSNTWNRVLTELANIPNLRNVHFMGGETLITPRFNDFVDFMISQGRLDLSFSFVTNGTSFDSVLMNKLSKFNRIGVEISIETLTEHNAYQRQGTDTAQVLNNIEQYVSWADGDKNTVTIRPAISLLTIGTYHTLLRYCLKHQLLVKGLIVGKPDFLDARILPAEVKQLYKQQYHDFLIEFDLDKEDATVDYNESDPHQLRRVIKNQAMQCINLLSTDTQPGDKHELRNMVEHCRKWDSVHGYNALLLYPELADVFTEYGY
jgi:hypothetical protein